MRVFWKKKTEEKCDFKEAQLTSINIIKNIHKNIHKKMPRFIVLNCNSRRNLVKKHTLFFEEIKEEEKMLPANEGTQMR